MPDIKRDRKKAPAWAVILIVLFSLALLWFIISYSKMEPPERKMNPTAPDSTSAPSGRVY